MITSNAGEDILQKNWIMWGCKMVQLHWKIVWQFLLKLKIMIHKTQQLLFGACIPDK